MKGRSEVCGAAAGARVLPSWVVVLLVAWIAQPTAGANAVQEPVRAEASQSSREHSSDPSATKPQAAEPPLEAAQLEETEIEEPELDEGSGPQRLFEELLVVGSADVRVRVPGSAHVIDAEALERQDYQDVHRVLRQVPGVNIQEEDGFGLRPNIGIRGTGVERSSKVTMLEDGVLIAPAPYSAPAAYYAPTAGRMEGFEIRKGSSAVRQGPYTNGGSINYLSREVPTAFDGKVEVAAGSHGLQRVQGSVGDGSERVAWLVQGYDLRTDGFKRLDGGGGTGFELSDYLGKLRFTSAPDAAVRQALELKIGKTEQRGDETYLGLTAGDFARDPYRRYVASAGDNIVTDHEQLQLSWEVRPNERLALTATLYRNDFFRNWAKLERVAGIGVSDVLADPERYATETAILRGELDSAAGALAVRNNRRDYYSQGLQAVLDLRFDRGRAEHELDIGFRAHEDQEDRFQENDLYQIVGGRRVFNALGAPGSNANRVAGAEALAFFVQDTVQAGRWTLTPGVRVESIDLLRYDYGTSDPERTGVDAGSRVNSLTEVIPGFGVAYALDSRAVAFVGVHRGFSPPGPGSTRDVKAEKSINYEAGWRFDGGSRRGEVVGFLTDYENLLGTDTASGGGTGSGDQFNGGAATVHGVEAGYGANVWTGRSFVVPLDLTYTYTRGEFDSTFETGFADWAPGVTAGDTIPYLPAHQLNATLSARANRWALHLDGHYSSSMRIKAGAGAAAPEDRIESRAVFDVRGEVTLAGRLTVFAQVLNVADEVYVAARRPAGLRPGMPRSASVGLRARFGGG